MRFTQPVIRLGYSRETQHFVETTAVVTAVEVASSLFPCPSSQKRTLVCAPWLPSSVTGSSANSVSLLLPVVPFRSSSVTCRASSGRAKECTPRTGHVQIIPTDDLDFSGQHDMISGTCFFG